MKTSSAKAKGRLLQQFFRDLLLEVYTDLEPDDIRSTAMGQQGEDVQLSPAAKEKFNYSVECKSHKAMAIYSFIDQAVEGGTGSPPLLVLKANRREPLVALYAEDFKKLLIEHEEGREAIWILEGLDK